MYDANVSQKKWVVRKSESHKNYFKVKFHIHSQPSFLILPHFWTQAPPSHFICCETLSESNFLLFLLTKKYGTLYGYFLYKCLVKRNKKFGDPYFREKWIVLLKFFLCEKIFADIFEYYLNQYLKHFI